MNTTDVVNSYVRVWNEPNLEERRRRIRSVWAPDGTTCYRLLDARGYAAVEARVTGSWDKWLSEGKYIFRPKRAASHHDVVKFDWEMVTVPGGEVEAAGLSFLVLNPDGTLQHDYQFNPSANDANELVERYLAVLNSTNLDDRRHRIAELWAPNGARIAETLISEGHGGIEAQIRKPFGTHVSKGFEFSPANSSQGHHNVATFKWHMRAKDTGKVAATGSNLLILDEDGLIRFDYLYDEPAQIPSSA